MQVSAPTAISRRTVFKRRWGAVVYIPFADGRPSGPPEDVVTGFLVDGDKARGRPVGLAVDGKGGAIDRR
jgi:glucose/arabinose dehydrogenase